MISEAWLKEKLTPFIKTKEADKAGVVYVRTSLEVSRFAKSQIHQHMRDEDQAIYFRVLINGRCTHRVDLRLRAAFVAFAVCKATSTNTRSAGRSSPRRQTR